jgi:signal transduction histidine kinase/CheY-like chemotaxis protein
MGYSIGVILIVLQFPLSLTAAYRGFWYGNRCQVPRFGALDRSVLLFSPFTTEVRPMLDFLTHLLTKIPKVLTLHTPAKMEEEVVRRTAEIARVNETLRQNEERLRLAVAAGRMVSWDWEIPTDRVTLSHGWETLHGIPPGSFSGTFDAYLSDIHPEDRESVARSLRSAVDQGTEHHIEYRLVWPDGSIHWIEARGRVLHDESGKPVRMIGICIDIKERKQAEQSLCSLYAQVKEADRRKDEFLAMLAHELRNPLAPICSGLDLLSMQGLDGTVGVMREQLRHLVRLVDDLLDVSRIVRGRIQVRKDRVRLDQIIERSLYATRPLIESRGQALTVSMPSSETWLDADPVRMAQIVTNLLDNAARYSPVGGHIWLTVQREADRAVICVRDNGNGIDETLLPRVFDLFTQGERTLDRPQGGLGIGLTLVKNLVEMHGGTVEARSEGVGKGSEFTIRLPVATRSPEPETRESNGQPDLPHRVLIVEDNVAAAKMLAVVLKAMGNHEVQVAYDGETALQVAKTFHPDLVLLDIGLPGIDGYEVARRLREGPEGDRPLVAAVTGYGQEDDRRRAHEAGFDEHLLKPVGVDVMRGLFRHPKLAQKQAV